MLLNMLIVYSVVCTNLRVFTSSGMATARVPAQTWLGLNFRHAWSFSSVDTPDGAPLLEGIECFPVIVLLNNQACRRVTLLALSHSPSSLFPQDCRTAVYPLVLCRRACLRLGEVSSQLTLVT